MIIRCFLVIHIVQRFPFYYRYFPRSRKEGLRNSRDLGASRVYHLRPTTKIPPQKVILTVTKNKSALIDLLCEDFIKHKEEFQHHRLVVTGSHSIPFELYKGQLIQRRDLETTQEEADTILLHQLAVVNPESALFHADDTDIFVELCHFSHHKAFTSQVSMVSPIRDRSVIDINESVAQNEDIMQDLLAMHGLIGGDTVAPYFGIGRGAALKVLKGQKHSLSLLGDITADLKDVVNQCTPFILACYGVENTQSANEARYRLWMKKVCKNIANAPKLQSLPPTEEALFQNIARAHIQVAVWKNALEPNPPALDPTDHGWYMEDGSLSPVMLPPNTPYAPEALLKVIKCSCKSDKACNSRRCSCSSADMACTLFCRCEGGYDCWNHHTRINDELMENDSDDEH